MIRGELVVGGGGDGCEEEVVIGELEEEMGVVVSAIRGVAAVVVPLPFSSRGSWISRLQSE